MTRLLQTTDALKADLAAIAAEAKKKHPAIRLVRPAIFFVRVVDVSQAAERALLRLEGVNRNSQDAVLGKSLVFQALSSPHCLCVV